MPLKTAVKNFSIALGFYRPHMNRVFKRVINGVLAVMISQPGKLLICVYAVL